MENDDIKPQMEFILKSLDELKAKMNALILPAAPKNKWLSSADIKKLLCISEGTLHRMREKNEIPYIKLRGSYFYPSIYFDSILPELTLKKFNDLWKEKELN